METDDVLAFHHTRPHWAVHIVVVPKVHIPSLTNLGGHNVELVYRLLDVVRDVAAEDLSASTARVESLPTWAGIKTSKHPCIFTSDPVRSSSERARNSQWACFATSFLMTHPVVQKSVIDRAWRLRHSIVRLRRNDPANR